MQDCLLAMGGCPKLVARRYSATAVLSILWTNPYLAPAALEVIRLQHFQNKLKKPRGLLKKSTRRKKGGIRWAAQLDDRKDRDKKEAIEKLYIAKLMNPKPPLARRENGAVGVANNSGGFGWHGFSATYGPAFKLRATNHFPGMRECATKCVLTNMINRLVDKGFQEEYEFYPRSWEVSNRKKLLAFKKEFEAGQVYIMKPSVGMQGDGVRVCMTWKHIVQGFNETSNCVIQRYIQNPLTLDGFKFDFRVYVCVASIKPLMAFVFHDGLSRMCTEKYEEPTPENFHKKFVHLTNYSLNKDSANFKSSPVPKRIKEAMEDQGVEAAEKASVDEEMASKRTISTTLRQLQEAGVGVDEDDFWEQIDDAVSKTLVAMLPTLWKRYVNFFYRPTQKVSQKAKDKAAAEIEEKSESESDYDNDDDDLETLGNKCFQLLGFDFLLDSDLDVHLLEVNQNPSFLCKESTVDDKIKQGVMARTLELLEVVPEKDDTNYPTIPSTVLRPLRDYHHILREVGFKYDTTCPLPPRQDGEYQIIY